MTVSFNEAFAASNPATINISKIEIIPISSQPTSSPLRTMSFSMVLARVSSTPLSCFKAFSSREISCSGGMSLDIDTEIGGTSCSGSGSIKFGAELDRGCVAGGGLRGREGRVIVAFARPSCFDGTAGGLRLGEGFASVRGG